jgi:hypothetical protein
LRRLTRSGPAMRATTHVEGKPIRSSRRPRRRAACWLRTTADVGLDGLRPGAVSSPSTSPGGFSAAVVRSAGVRDRIDVHGGERVVFVVGQCMALGGCRTVAPCGVWAGNAWRSVRTRIAEVVPDRHRWLPFVPLVVGIGERSRVVG